jgi:ATPase
MIPQIIDTIVHIEDGDIGKVLNLDFSVKIPEGMTVPDLARPVIQAKDFETGVCEFEIYTYGEQIVVVPVKKRGVTKKKILKNIDKFVGVDYELHQLSPTKGILYVSEEYIPEIIGKKGKNISEIEREVGMKLDVQPLQKKIHADIDFTKKSGRISVSPRYKNRDLTFFYKGEQLFSATVGKKGVIRLDLKSKLSSMLYDIWQKGEHIYALER